MVVVVVALILALILAPILALKVILMVILILKVDDAKEEKRERRGDVIMVDEEGVPEEEVCLVFKQKIII